MSHGKARVFFLFAGVAVLGPAAGCATGGTAAGVCGNDRIDPGEQCDGLALGGQSCTTQGLGNGTLGCLSDCTYNRSGCDGNCVNQCQTQSETRCAGNAIETCALSQAGCLYWQMSQDCQASGLLCDDSGATAICTDTCSDACAANDTQCSGSVLQTCQPGDNGCYQWKDTEDCSISGGSCFDDGSAAQCVAACNDQCAQVGDTRCVGDMLQSCTADAYGCLDYQDLTDCTINGMVCNSGATPPACEPDCTDACSSGQTQCSGDTAQDCQLGTNGCYAWVDVEDCSTTGRSCSSGACVCDDQCTSGQTQCNGTIVQDCVADSYGCYDWQNGQDCAVNGEICSAGGCVPGSVGYVMTNFTGTYNSIGGTGTDVTGGITYTDDGRWSFTLPFTVYFYGVAYTTAWMCTNGWVSFGSDPGTNVYSNTSLPASGAPNQAIYPWWDDLVYDEAEWADAAMVYQVSGSSPNRVLTIEWNNLRYVATGGSFSHKAAFQVILYESTNVIEIIYNRSVWMGANYSGTIGIEDDTVPDGMDIGTAFLTPPAQDLRFTPN